MNASLLDWIRDQQPVLEKIIVDTAQAFHTERLEDKNHPYHMQVARMESYNLVNGEDLCYDTPSVGLMYSLWYQPRRVNTCLCIIAESLAKAGGRKIDLFDLGSGLGAMQWACGLVYASMEANDVELPDLRIMSIDTSPFMAEYQVRLWRAFVARYPVCKSIHSEYEINSWINRRKEYNPIWISASYLFDHSDKEDILARDFASLIEAYQPEQIFLSGSIQLNKKKSILHITKDLVDSGYDVSNILGEQLFTGESRLLTSVREKIDEKLKVKKSKAVQWHESGFFGTALKRQQQDLAFGQANGRRALTGIDLFNPPIVVRRDIILSSDQEQAAKHSERPAFIFGPAGCGKSVVITERIKNMVEEANYAPNFRILLTTFNKELIKALYGWLEDILDTRYCSATPPKEPTYSDYEFYFRGSKIANITLMHFDILPTRIGGFKEGVMDESERKRIIERIIEEVQLEMKETGLRIDNPERILNVDFIRDEYDRVYYGLWLRTEEEYLNGDRPGRPTLHKNQAPRRLAWKCVKKLNEAILICRRKPFIYKRMLLREALRKNEYSELFTHIFVDEFQDCTKSDFGIFYGLLDDPNHLVVGGDLAQALHLGRSASFPRLPISDQKYIERKELKGSYRLPFRISESLLKLSGRIYEKRKLCGDASDVRMLNPYKGSPPGARPIVIWAENVEELAEKAKSVIETYRAYDIDQVKVMETDRELSSALNKKLDGISVGGDTVLRIKGLECTCVIWSTRRPVISVDEAEEFVYTILTRTSGLLIIALCPDTLDSFKPIINTFDRKRLIFWDGLSWHKYADSCEDKDISGDYEPIILDESSHVEDLLPL